MLRHVIFQHEVDLQSIDQVDQLNEVFTYVFIDNSYMECVKGSTTINMLAETGEAFDMWMVEEKVDSMESFLHHVHERLLQ